MAPAASLICPRPRFGSCIYMYSLQFTTYFLYSFGSPLADSYARGGGQASRATKQDNGSQVDRGRVVLEL